MELKSHITTDYFRLLDDTSQTYHELLQENKGNVNLENCNGDSNASTSTNNSDVYGAGTFSDYLKFTEDTSLGSPLKLPSPLKLLSPKPKLQLPQIDSTNIKKLSPVAVESIKVDKICNNINPDNSLCMETEKILRKSQRVETSVIKPTPVIIEKSVIKATSVAAAARTLPFQPKNASTNASKSMNYTRGNQMSNLVTKNLLEQKRIPSKMFQQKREIPPNVVAGFKKNHVIQASSSRTPIYTSHQRSFKLGHYQSSAFSSQLSQRLRPCCSQSCLNQPAVVILPVATYVSTQRNLDATFQSISRERIRSSSNCQQTVTPSQYFVSVHSRNNFVEKLPNSTFSRNNVYDMNALTNQYYSNNELYDHLSTPVMSYENINYFENKENNFQSKPSSLLTHFSKDHLKSNTCSPPASQGLHDSVPCLPVESQNLYKPDNNIDLQSSSITNKAPAQPISGDQNDIIFDLENEEMSSLFYSSLNTERYPGSEDAIQAIKENLLRETSPIAGMINDGQISVKKEKPKSCCEVKSKDDTKPLKKKEITAVPVQCKKNMNASPKPSPGYLNSGKKSKMMGLGDYDEVFYTDTSDFNYLETDEYSLFKKRMMRDNPSSKHNMKLRKRSSTDSVEGTENLEENIVIKPPKKRRKRIEALKSDCEEEASVETVTSNCEEEASAQSTSRKKPSTGALNNVDKSGSLSSGSRSQLPPSPVKKSVKKFTTTRNSKKVSRSPLTKTGPQLSSTPVKESTKGATGVSATPMKVAVKRFLTPKKSCSKLLNKEAAKSIKAAKAILLKSAKKSAPKILVKGPNTCPLKLSKQLKRTVRVKTTPLKKTLALSKIVTCIQKADGQIDSKALTVSDINSKLKPKTNLVETVVVPNVVTNIRKTNCNEIASTKCTHNAELRRSFQYRSYKQSLAENARVTFYIGQPSEIEVVSLVKEMIETVVYKELSQASQNKSIKTCSPQNIKVDGLQLDETIKEVDIKKQPTKSETEKQEKQEVLKKRRGRPPLSEAQKREREIAKKSKLQPLRSEVQKREKKESAKLIRRKLPMRASARKAKQKKPISITNISRLQSRRIMKKKFLHKCCHKLPSHSKDIMMSLEGDSFTVFPSQGLKLIVEAEEKEKDNETVENVQFVDNGTVPDVRSVVNLDEFPPSPSSIDEMHSGKKSDKYPSLDENDDMDSEKEKMLPRKRFASVDADDQMSDKSHEEKSPDRSNVIVDNPVADFLHFVISNDALLSP